MSSPIHALDGQILDEEIDNSLFDDLTNSLKDSNLPLSIQRLHSRHSDDLKLILKLILFKLFIWDKSTSYGFLLQNLKLKVGKAGKLVILISILLNHLYSKLDSLIHSQEENVSAGVEDVGARDILLSELQKWSPTIMKSSNMISLIVSLKYLLTGKHLNFLHWILNIEYTPLNALSTSFISNPESISYEFQNRQLIWNGVTEFLKVISHWKLPSNLISIWRSPNANLGNYVNLPLRCCAICYDKSHQKVIDDNLIHNPWVTDCGHIYCYICILNELKTGSGSWQCLRCQQKVFKVELFKEGMDYEEDNDVNSESEEQSENESEDEDESESEGGMENSDNNNDNIQNNTTLDDNEFSDSSASSFYEYEDDNYDDPV